MSLAKGIESVLLRHGGYPMHSDFIWACKCGWTGDETWASHVRHLADVLVAGGDS